MPPRACAPNLRLIPPWDCGPVHARDLTRAAGGCVQYTGDPSRKHSPARLLGVDALSPLVGNLILKVLGVIAFQRRIIEASAVGLPKARSDPGGSV